MCDSAIAQWSNAVGLAIMNFHALSDRHVTLAEKIVVSLVPLSPVGASLVVVVGVVGGWVGAGGGGEG